MFGWLGAPREKDVKVNIISPATEVHIRKARPCLILAIDDA